ncbi:MAG: hypothetical protein WKG00_31075 [Polyangiaceae bacterium]
MRSLVAFSIACVVAACGDDGTDDPDAASGSDTSSGSASSSSGGPQGVACAGGFCGANEYCGFADGVCGYDNRAPACQPFPPCQPESVACGCDGVSYPSGCAAADASGGISHQGACEPPDGKFSCTYEYQAPIYCALGAEFCKVTPVAKGDYPLECVPWLAGCTPAPDDCSCATCGSSYCAVSEDLQEMTVYCN